MTVRDGWKVNFYCDIMVMSIPEIDLMFLIDVCKFMSSFVIIKLWWSMCYDRICSTLLSIITL